MFGLVLLLFGCLQPSAGDKVKVLNFDQADTAVLSAPAAKV